MDSRDRSEAVDEQVETPESVTQPETGFSITVIGNSDPQIKLIGRPPGQLLHSLSQHASHRFEAMREAEEGKILLTILQNQVQLQKQQERIETMVGLLGKVVGTTDSNDRSADSPDRDGS